VVAGYGELCAPTASGVRKLTDCRAAAMRRLFLELCREGIRKWHLYLR